MEMDQSSASKPVGLTVGSRVGPTFSPIWMQLLLLTTVLSHLIHAHPYSSKFLFEVPNLHLMQLIGRRNHRSEQTSLGSPLSSQPHLSDRGNEEEVGDTDDRITVDDIITVDCQMMTERPGIYAYYPHNEPDTQCDLYIIGSPDKIIEIEFLYFHISCKYDGILTFLDGWEMEGQYFPPITDHDLPFPFRTSSYCGKWTPMDRVRPLVSHQNVAKIQYRITGDAPGQGWIMKLTYRENPKPCNVVSTESSGIYQLTSSAGRARNCSLSILYPAQVTTVELEVGVEEKHGVIRQIRGETITKCSKRGLRDYVELRSGNSLDYTHNRVMREICGEMLGMIEADSVLLPCDNTVVRLVSSGDFRNTITIAYQLPQISNGMRELLQPICTTSEGEQ